MFAVITDHLLEFIERDSLKVGDKLPREADLAQQLNVSRPTLRQSLRILENAGVLTIRQGVNGGIFVASDVIPLSLVQDSTAQEIDSMNSLLRTRHLVEPIVAHLAAENATPDELDAVAYAIDLMDKHRNSREMMLRVDGMYHRRVAIASHDEILRAAMYSLYRRLLPLRAELGRREPSVDHMIDVHTRQLDAIRARDHERIDELMEESFRDLESDASLEIDYVFRWHRTSSSSGAERV